MMRRNPEGGAPAGGLQHSFEERSLLLDIRLLLMTVPAVLPARGAY